MIKTTCRAGLVSVLLLGAAGCGSASQTPAANTAKLVTGGLSCPIAEKQDLTFTGAIAGHLVCSTSTATCAKEYGNAQSSGGLSVPINARIGATQVQLLFAFGGEVVGTVPAGRLGDEQNSTGDGATLDGISHWETLTGSGGSMAIVTDDASGASGSADVTLTKGNQTVEVSGTWRCVKPPGF